MEIETALAAFLRAEAQRVWDWGTHDCGLWLGDWLVLRGHTDPFADLRGTYGSEDECRARFGPAPVLREGARRFARLGLAQTVAPWMGDIAVLRIARIAAGALRARAGFVVPGALFGEKGITKLADGDVRFRVMRAWRVGNA